MKNIYFYDTTLGKIAILEQNEQITNVYFDSEKFNLEAYTIRETNVLKEASKQLDEYLSGVRKSFDLPLHIIATDFRKQVYQSLLKIPYGETKSYKEIAAMIGNDKASRAVGQANNKNPLPIFIPCHRVIGANKKLVGYGGGLDKKIILLDLEKRSNNNVL